MLIHPLSSVRNSNAPLKNSQTPAEVGVWVLILGDMLVFAVLFFSYMWARSQDHQIFAQSQASLNQYFGVINTLLLLTGSLFVILSLHLLRNKQVKYISILLISAMSCGVLFFVNKVIEYKEKISQGYTLLTNDFFMYYYMLTGIHLLHVCAGTVLLLYLWLKLKKTNYHTDNIKHLESGGVIWHMVDMLWIMLFPLLYLIK